MLSTTQLKVKVPVSTTTAILISYKSLVLWLSAHYTEGLTKISEYSRDTYVEMLLILICKWAHKA